MPQVESSTVVAVPPAVAFAVSQTTGAVRLSWDPFISGQHFLHGATTAARGVETYTRSRHGFAMISRYVSYSPPTSGRPSGNVGMTMVKGPWFFAGFGGGWRFSPTVDGGTTATWKYTFRCRPGWSTPISHRIGRALLQHDIDRRIAAFARACTNPAIVASATAT